MSYEIAGVIGDVNPLQYGGWLIASREAQIDALVIEPIDYEGQGRQGEGIDAYVYRVALDRMKVVGDIATRTDVLVSHSWQNNWHGNLIDRTEWWDKAAFWIYLQAESGITWEKFTEAIGSESPLDRAWAWREIAWYYGVHQLDDSPTRESESSLRARFALPFYRARKRGVTVYA